MGRLHLFSNEDPADHQGQATLSSVAENSTDTPSSTPVELLSEVRYVRRGSSSSMTSQLSERSPSATGSTAAARGLDAVDAGVTLGYNTWMRRRNGWAL